MESAASGTKVDERLATALVPIKWQIPAAANVSAFEALPPAAKDREIKKAADTFASTGRNVFVHYVTPILYKRRELLLASGTAKKKYHKTTAQLWTTLLPDDTFFWNQAAKELRTCMKQGILNPKGCLVNAGRLSERPRYVSYAEKAVAAYLNLPPPSDAAIGEDDRVSIEVKGGVEVETLTKLNISLGSLALKDSAESNPMAQTNLVASSVDIKLSEDCPTIEARDSSNRARETELLDTLPAPFEFEQNMLYSHFAHYDLNEVRTAVGRTQTMLLRHLAERFEKTGKILFYYYVVPRLCKQTYPPSKGHTVTSQAADMWRFMLGEEKEKWRAASAALKKQLGDGDVVGLEVLQLDSLDPEVLRLHALAQAAIDSHEICQKNKEG